MPTYEYQCLSCRHKFEILQPFGEKPKTKCPKCGRKLKKIISGTAGFIFKGPGFYSTDYKKSNKPSDSPKVPVCPKVKQGCTGCL
jgi:putative FmdB family regulatory protein